MPIPQAAKPSPPASAKEIVYTTVQDWIITGILSPGEKIVDKQLADYFSVSRTPVREAIQLLNKQGLVEVVPSCGTRVSEIDWEDVRQNYEALTELHCVIARLIIDKIDGSHIEALTKLNKEFADAIDSGDVKKQSECDKAFHNYLVHLANNHYIAQYIDQLSLSAQRVENLYFSVGSRRDNSVKEHEEIINGLISHDLEAVEKALRNNWITGVTMYNYFKSQNIT